MELHTLTPHLKQLRRSGILETLDVRHQPAIAAQRSYAQFLERLLQDEVERRNQKQLTLRLRRAAFQPDKTLERFDFAFARYRQGWMWIGAFDSPPGVSAHD